MPRAPKFTRANISDRAGFGAFRHAPSVADHSQFSSEKLEQLGKEAELEIDKEARIAENVGAAERDQFFHEMRALMTEFLCDQVKDIVDRQEHPARKVASLGRVIRDAKCLLNCRRDKSQKRYEHAKKLLFTLHNLPDQLRQEIDPGRALKSENALKLLIERAVVRREYWKAKAAPPQKGRPGGSQIQKQRLARNFRNLLERFSAIKSTDPDGKLKTKRLLFLETRRHVANALSTLRIEHSIEERKPDRFYGERTRRKARRKGRVPFVGKT